MSFWDRPLCVDLFTGLHGWADGFVAEGWSVIGVDIVDMSKTVGLPKPDNFQLILQDVLSLHGSQFKKASCIVCSPPCQEFSWMAMPWSRAKQVARALREEDEFPEGYRGSRTIADLTRLFDACFRIQREACEAAGRHIPLIVENVRGAIPWVGRSRWNWGSFHLWGDVPALMPITSRASKVPGFRFDGSGGSFQSASVARTGVKNPGLNWSKYGDADYRTSGAGACFRDSAIKNSGLKVPAGTRWFNDAPRSPVSLGSSSSKSPARKAASAMIAKIPFPLAQYIAATFKPESLS